MSQNKILFLGTGTSVGVPMIGCTCAVCLSEDNRDKRLRTSALLEVEGKNILIDIGPDFRQQMLLNQVNKIDSILLTHPHRDHVGGFDDIRALNFLYESKIDLFANAFTWDSLTKQFYYAFAESDYTSLPSVHYRLIDRETFEWNKISITPIEVMHGKMPCLGYRIKNLAYITDANYISETEFDKLKDLDVLVINALRRQHHPSHFTLQEAIAISQKVRAKRTYLTHLSHHMGKHIDVELELPQNIFLGHDGLQVIF